MKKLDRIFIFVILLIGFGFSVCILSLFYPIPFVYDVITYDQSALPWLNSAFGVYSATICLCFFVLLLVTLFFHDQSNFLIIIKDRGKLEFSKKTIESTIRYSFADLDEITFSKVKVKINKIPDKMRVYVKLSLNDTRELASLTETVQEKIASSLKTSLNITAKSIMIKVIQSPTHKDDEPVLKI